MEISVRILVKVVMINIKKGITLQQARQMNVKVQAYTWHFSIPSALYVPVDVDNLFRGIFPTNVSQFVARLLDNLRYQNRVS